MFIEDYMSPDPVTIRQDAPIAEAASLMQQNRFRQLPVMDPEGRLVGIITNRDVRLTVGFDEPLRETLTVADLMNPDPVTIPLSATVDEAIGVLVKHRFGALPVVRENRLVGIITYIDVLRAFAEVFGLDQPGYRIDVALPDGYADVARAFQSLKDSGSTLLAAVVSRTRRDGGEPALYLRVAREQREKVERQLRASRLILLQTECEKIVEC